MCGLSVNGSAICAIIARNERGNLKMLHSPEVSNILRRLATATGELVLAKNTPFACYNFQRRRCTKGYDLRPVSMQRRFQGSRGLKHVRPLKMGDNQA